MTPILRESRDRCKPPGPDACEGQQIGHNVAMSDSLPLSGITVVELGHSVAAPYAGLILAGLGADVIKVENPDGGDHARDWGPPFWHGAAAIFQTLNRDKTGVSVDLANDEARALLRALIVERADVVLQNMRPGIAERFGLGAEELRTEKAELIYCTIGAFGAVGPLADRPGYDPLMQGFAGIMSVTGEVDGEPVRAGTSIIDMGAGMWAAIGVLAALERRHRTGEGGAGRDLVAGNRRGVDGLPCRQLPQRRYDRGALRLGHAGHGALPGISDGGRLTHRCCR